MRLRGTRLDAHWLDTYRSHVTFFDPSASVSMVGVDSSRLILERIRAISFTTVGAEDQTQLVYTRWCEQLLPAFAPSSRLVIDFAANDELKMLSLVQVMAYRTKCETPTQSVRSSASSRENNRRVVYVVLDRDEDEQHILETFRSGFTGHGLHHVVIGREVLYQLPKDVYMLTFNDPSWIEDTSVVKLLEDVVFAASCKAIFRLRKAHTHWINWSVH